MPDSEATLFNPNAAVVDEMDGASTPVPFSPDWFVVRHAIKRHRDGYRDPVQFDGDPFAEVSV